MKVWKDGELVGIGGSGEDLGGSILIKNVQDFLPAANVEVWAAADNFPPTNAVIKDFHFTGRENFFLRIAAYCILYIVLKNIVFIPAFKLKHQLGKGSLKNVYLI